MQPARPDACRFPFAMAPLIAAVSALIACDPASVVQRPITPQVVWGETGGRPGQFFYPRALDADRNGRIWIIDKTARVQALDPDTGDPLFTWRMPNYQLGKPTGMTFAPGPDGRELLYIADTHYHRIMVYRTPTTPGQREQLVASFGSYGDQPGQFIYPTDVAVLTDQQTGLPTRIYVSEYGGNDRISVFDPDYNFLFAFGSPGSSADPATIIAAVCPVPDTMSEYQFAGILRGRRVELVACKTVPLKVPAAAEIVLEGHVSLAEYGDEGPFGDHTGYYNAVEKFPVFTISAITRRAEPIYLSTFTGRAPDEPSVLARALNEVFLPILIRQFPEIVDFYLPPEGCSYRIAVVSIRKAYPGHAKRVMMGIWSYLRQFLYTKFIFVVDDDIDVRDWGDVMWAVSTRMDPARDITVIENAPIDYLDFASPVAGLGGKIGLDATTKIPPETNREWGRKIRMSDEVIEKVDGMWSALGLPGSGKSIWK